MYAGKSSMPAPRARRRCCVPRQSKATTSALRKWRASNSARPSVSNRAHAEHPGAWHRSTKSGAFGVRGRISSSDLGATASSDRRYDFHMSMAMTSVVSVVSVYINT